MRRTKGAHIFKGSIFVTFKDKEEAKAFLENNELTKYKENELIKIFQEAYWANKQKQLKEKRKAEQKLKKTQKNLVRLFFLNNLSLCLRKFLNGEIQL